MYSNTRLILQNPVFKREIDARKLWEKIVHNAWKSAEPGILFWDTIIRESVPDCYADLGYRTVSTNPCGEIPLCPYDSCRLIAINLYSYVNEPFTHKAKFNFDLFKKHVHYAQRIMDDIIDLELEKIDAILDKINKDPEDPELKRVEKKLWENIRVKAEEGRRPESELLPKEICWPALDCAMAARMPSIFQWKCIKPLPLKPTVFG